MSSSYETEQLGKTTGDMLANRWKRIPSKKHPGEASTCNRCGQIIEWWMSPKGKSVPFDACIGDTIPRVCHFGSCPVNPDKEKPPASGVTGVYPADQVEELREIKKTIVNEYAADCEGDMMYKDPEHKCNWLYKRLVEARYKLQQAAGRG